MEKTWDDWKNWALGGHTYAFLSDLALSGHRELERLVGCPQNKWHKGNDVWEHTQAAVFEASKLAYREEVDDDTRLVLIFWALCHDMGKPFKTQRSKRMDDWFARGHEAAGVKPAISFLRRIGMPAHLIDRIVPLVIHHGANRTQLVNNAHLLNLLSISLQEATIQEYLWVVKIDMAAVPGGGFVSHSIDKIKASAQQGGFYIKSS